MDVLISSGVFALVLVLSLVLFTGGRRDGDKAKAQEMLERVTRAETNDDAGQLLRRDPRLRLEGRVVLNAIYRLHLPRRLEENMWQAGVYMHVSEMLLIMVLLFGAGAAAGQLVLRDAWFALLAGAAAGALPLAYIRFRRKRRMRAFAMQLPFALDLIKSSLEAGHSLMRGLQVLVQEFNDPLGGEFRTVLEQTRLGMALPRAFDDLLARVPEEDLRLLVVAVKVQSEVGSSLAQIIGRLSEIVRTRQRLQAQIHAMTAQSRMSGMIVGLLPIIVLAAFSLIQPNYTHVLFYNPTGIKVVKAAIVLDAMAFFTIRRILRIDY
jgi:tight adherence protein B